MNTTTLTIFYDSLCPLCAKEMDHLKRRDKQKKIDFVSLQDPQCQIDYPELDIDKAMRVLHAKHADGHWLQGLDVTHHAWSLVGRGFLTAPLRWPGVSRIADVAYLFFAKHRYRISFWLTGQARCVPCAQNNAHTDSCSVSNKK